MPELVHDQRSPEWFTARDGKITASVAAACLGMDPHMSAARAWRKVMGMEKDHGNRHTRWGVEHEARARREYEAESGSFVSETGFWVHTDLPWLGASPDGLVGSCGLLEVKCPGKLPDAVPLPHRIQCLVQLAVTGRQWCDYFVWTMDGVFLRRIMPSGVSGIIRRLAQFHADYVVSGVEPPSKRRRKTKPEREAQVFDCLEPWLEWLESNPMLEGVNATLQDLHIVGPDVKRKAWALVKAYADRRGWEFDKEAKKFRSVA